MCQDLHTDPILLRENAVKARLREWAFILERGFSKESGLSSPLPSKQRRVGKPALRSVQDVVIVLIDDSRLPRAITW